MKNVRGLVLMLAAGLALTVSVGCGKRLDSNLSVGDDGRIQFNFKLGPRAVDEVPATTAP